MRLFGDSIKVKVVVGFGLAISMVVVAIYLTYASFTQLLNSVDELAKPNIKLSSLHRTLSTISSAESSIRAYTLTTKEQHFKSYLSHLDTIEGQLDTLRFMMQDSKSNVAQIDSIAILLKTKQNSMQRFVALKKEQQRLNPSDKALRQIVSVAESKQMSTTIRQHTTTTISDRLPKDVEQTQEQAESGSEAALSKKGFFNKLFSRKGKASPQASTPPQVIKPEINVTREIKVDTNKVVAPVTQLAKVRRILNNVKRESEKKEAMLQAEEMALLQQDKQIMDQIRGMMYELEKHEEAQEQLNSVRAREEAKKTSTILLLVGVIGLGGGIAFILVILRDITRSNNYKSSLIRAQKQSVQLARAKEAFVANMSHEMRTPLNVILGFTEQMQHTNLQKQQQEHVQAINSAGQHLLHIVNDVLDLSKIEAGKLSISSAPFSLQQLITELKQAFTLKAAAKGISFQSHVSEDMPDVLQGDALRIKQVLLNLIDNAIKFTHEGKVQVNIGLKSQRRNRITARITVSDTGIGISKDQLQHVFGEFNQADDSILRKYGGTGLGLSISKKLVEMQGGTMTVSSEAGKGTTFAIVLPLLASQQSIIVPAQPILSTGSFDGYKALVIDDDAYSRTLAELILTRWGIKVYLANDGHEALELVKNKKFDVVLTDLQLPGVSGKTVSRAIRKYDKQVPVLALSANILSNDPDFFKGSAITGHLLKPYTEVEMHQLLASVLPLSPANTAPAQSINAAAIAPEAESQLYSLEEISLFTGSDEQLLITVLEVLLNDQKQSLALLKAHASAEDWDKAGSVAHKMITGFKQLKADTVVPHLAILENVLHNPDIDKATLPDAAMLAEANATEVLDALKQQLESIKQVTAQPVS
ncbi:signal transduction histidine kinase/DNA-binding response OmpR family regulator [Pontibacter aydingkolensis]|uniref:histidine kinase n=1 Tax=Pontibacter aydingkolensis TaxID=1911536 RepID=A0ABS7CT55_9BACT|nr:ATP-binding protein [Pontibacter aydingkolensis]MBW7467028.1 response regulator [Pontibacter aydingkolensis]